MRPACMLAVAVPPQTSHLVIDGGREAFGLAQRRIHFPQSNLPHVRVDGNGASFVEREQTDAVCHLEADTMQRDEGVASLHMARLPRPQLPQPLSPAVLQDGGCRLQDELGAVACAESAQIILVRSGQRLDRREAVKVVAALRPEKRAVAFREPVHHERDPRNVVVGRADEAEEALDRVLAQHAQPGEARGQLRPDRIRGAPQPVQRSQRGGQSKVFCGCRHQRVVGLHPLHGHGALGARPRAPARCHRRNLLAGSDVHALGVLADRHHPVRDHARPLAVPRRAPPERLAADQRDAAPQLRGRGAQATPLTTPWRSLLGTARLRLDRACEHARWRAPSRRRRAPERGGAAEASRAQLGRAGQAPGARGSGEARHERARRRRERARQRHAADEPKPEPERRGSRHGAWSRKRPTNSVRRKPTNLLL